ncbi:MAG: RNA polymerase sigma factor [Bacteroidetes bacterium]|nr:RNA polymerase sigma factor [Bacteroidota bacterium]
MLPEVMKGPKLELLVDDLNYETELIKLAGNGDDKAFKELFQQNVSRVYALCLRFSADKDTADDLTQKVFIKAWEKLKTFRGESRFSTWLHRIAVNIFLMHKRAEKRFLKKTPCNEQIWINKNGKIESNVEINIDLEKAIASLPKQARMVLILHDIEGYKHKEISDMLKIRIGTSKANLHRARKQLREELLK